MDYKTYRIGDVATQYDEINKDLEFSSIESLQGINSLKFFQECKSNKNDIELSRYRICRNNTFAYNKATSRNGEKISIAYRTQGDCLVSPSYVTFAVTALDIVSPEYLMLWFMRQEFDRYVRYNSWGSATEFFPWESMANTEIALPPIEEQRKIVRQYKTLQTRSEVLYETEKSFETIIQTMFDETFMKDENKTGTINGIANVNPNRKLSKNMIANCFEMVCLPTSGCILKEGEQKAYAGGARFVNGDTLIARISPCLENGKAAFVNCLKDGEVAFGSTEYIVFEPKTNIPAEFIYFLIRNSQFVTFARQFMNGTSGRQRVSGEELASFKMSIPSQTDLDKFGKLAKAFSRFALFCERERRCLKNEMELMLRSMEKNA